MSAEVAPAAGTPSTVSRRLGVASLYVLLGNVFTLAVGLPLQIYVSRVLGPSGVGVYGLLDAAMSTAAGLLGLGIGQTAMRFLPAHLERGEHEDALRLVRMGAIILLGVGAGAYAVLLLSLPWLGYFWPAVAPYREELAAMGLLIPLGLLIYFLQQALRGLQEIRQVILGSSVVQLTVKAALTVAAFAIGLRLDGYILASILATLCGVLWLSYNLLGKLRALPSAPAAASAFPQWRRYALIIYSGALIGTIVSGLDRFLVGGFIGSAAVGVLLVARQLDNLFERLNQMLLMAGAPLLSAAHARTDRTERQHIFCLMTDWSVRSALPLLIFLLLFGRPVLALYGSEFAERGALPLQILVVTQFFGLLCGPVGNVALMSGLERQTFYLSIASTAVMLIMLVVLVPRFELVGAAIALAFGIAFMNIGTTLLDRLILHMHWWDKRYLAWLPQASASLLLGVFVLYMHVPLKAVTLFAVLAAMYVLALAVNLTWGLHDDDRDLLRHIAPRAERLIGRKNLPAVDRGR